MFENNKIYKQPIFWAFALFFIWGVGNSHHYGLGWDDEVSRIHTGHLNFNYIFNGEKAQLLDGHEKYHGPFFEMVLIVIEKVFNINDLHEIYKMRHFVLFITFFIATLFFIRFYWKNLRLR